MKSLYKTEQISCCSDVLKFVQEAIYPDTIKGFLKVYIQ